MVDADEFLAFMSDFEEVLASKETKDSRRDCIFEHFNKIDKGNRFNIPDFDADLKWLNVLKPLKFGQPGSLEGKVVVLDFFTYCCVNCLHVLPDLHRLEQCYSPQDGLVIVGVHSAKFMNEKVTANILSAVLRYDITHPVVNDSEASLWNKLSIMCWPTFVVVSPQGKLLYYIVGEGHSDTLFEFVELALEHYGKQSRISPHPLPLSLERDREEWTTLSFPGKVHLGPTPDRLVVSDTGYHRILILDRLTGIVQTTIGGKQKGFKDGNLSDALFNSPQGVASHGNLLFIADTENHALRQVDLFSGQVSTLAGTGVQGTDKEGGKPGPEQLLSTPWDVAVGTSPDASEPDVIFMAMAGTHQIWAYFLKDTLWWKKKSYKAGTCVCIAGSGEEENRNNSYPHKSAFAQPSGLALSPKDSLNTLFVADSESSTVRALSLKDGSVKGLVGGDRDPKYLFAYGDVDGTGIEARLQHPLAVTLLSPSGPLIVADSYNHKVKAVDVKTKQCTTVDTSLSLNEPGGLCADPTSKLVYIADTNNHCIKVLDWKTKEMSQLPVIFPSDEDAQKDEVEMDAAAMTKGTALPELSLQPGGILQFSLHLKFSPDAHANTEAPNSWKLSGGDEEGKRFLSSMEPSVTKGRLQTDGVGPQLLTSLSMTPDPGVSRLTLVLTCQVFVCRQDSSACTIQRKQFVQKLVLSPEGLLMGMSDVVIEVE